MMKEPMTENSKMPRTKTRLERDEEDGTDNFTERRTIPLTTVFLMINVGRTAVVMQTMTRERRSCGKSVDLLSSTLQQFSLMIAGRTAIVMQTDCGADEAAAKASSLGEGPVAAAGTTATLER
jgi:hypothetical protein